MGNSAFNDRLMWAVYFAPRGLRRAVTKQSLVYPLGETLKLRSLFVLEVFSIVTCEHNRHIGL